MNRFCDSGSMIFFIVVIVLFNFFHDSLNSSYFVDTFSLSVKSHQLFFGKRVNKSKLYTFGRVSWKDNTYFEYIIKSKDMYL